MANPSKQKGDRGEREAVEVLKHLVPHLASDRARRKLGAGRKDDEGDLEVFDDVSIQVKVYAAAKLGAALREAAIGAEVQRRNARNRLGVGMVPVPLARTGTVRWLAAVRADAQWPTPIVDDPIEFSLVSRLVTWVRDDEGPHGFMAYPRDERIGLLTSGNSPTDIIVAPIEAWLGAYEDAQDSPTELRPTG